MDQLLAPLEAFGGRELTGGIRCSNRLAREYRDTASHSTWASVTEAADRLGEDAAKDLERAKGGLSRLGRAGVDIAERTIEIGFDYGVSAMTGGSNLPAVFVRTFGAAAQEARRDGASIDEQVLYGSIEGGIEAMTDLLASGKVKMPNKSGADRAVIKTLRRLKNSPTGTVLLKALGSSAGAGLQEKLKPAIKRIYQEDIPMAENSSNIDPSDIMYSALLGFTVGMLDGGVGVITRNLK